MLKKIITSIFLILSLIVSAVPVLADTTTRGHDVEYKYEEVDADSTWVTEHPDDTYVKIESPRDGYLFWSDDGTTVPVSVNLFQGWVSVSFPVGSQSGSSGDASVPIEPYRYGRIEVKRKVIRTKYKKYKRYIGTSRWIDAGYEYRTTFGDARLSIDYK